jgi:serine/threonine-protein kinase
MTGPRDAADLPPPVTPDGTPARMTPERWRAVEAVLQAALDRAPTDRPAFIAEACGADAALRHEVESILAAAPASEFLERAAAAEVMRAMDTPLTTRGAERDAGRAGAVTLAQLSSALAGRYAVARELGRGGMATVYLARDLRHRRSVAVKVLHPELSAALGAERFLREIELTASLQHPHILPLFDSGAADGLLWYVMPFVDGETLRARLARERQLPIDDALRIAGEVASALEHAHRHGIVHRDVKPENILLGDDGQALVADFGIALAVRQAGGTRMTRTGLSLGTPQYMSPEQATGDRGVDARSDVYALGAVTYEMLAGEPPFTGPTAQAVLAKILGDHPAAPTRTRRTVPPHVEAAVPPALEKLPADRYGSATDFAAALAPPTGSHVAARPHVLAPRTMAALAVGHDRGGRRGMGVGRADGRAAAANRKCSSARSHPLFSSRVIRRRSGAADRRFAPDGRTVVYAREGPTGATVRPACRRTDATTAPRVRGRGQQPFFSPDGAWVASLRRGALRKVRLDGGPPVVVTEIPPPAQFAGGSWGDDGRIVYAVGWSNAVYQVSAEGGVAERVPVADTTQEVGTPSLLPGSRAALVSAMPTSATTGERIAVLDLATGRLRRFGSGFGPRYVGGHVVYATAAGALYRQPFDLERLEATGTAEQVATGLALLMGGAPAFDVSRSGTLAYRVGGSPSEAANLRLTLTDRSGRELRAIPARVPWTPRFSPDGGRIAYAARAPGRDSSDLWITDVASGATQRLTADANESSDPQWSPDGRALAFSANAAGAKDVFVQPLDGGLRRLLTGRPGYQFPADWSRDARAVLFVDVATVGDRAGNQDLWVQPLDGGAARPYLRTSAREVGARVSPDGRWVAYTSDETGRDEVYVQSYPTPGRKALVSAQGGMHPVWRRDGRELYYWHGEQLIASQVEDGGATAPLSCEVGRPSSTRPIRAACSRCTTCQPTVRGSSSRRDTSAPTASSSPSTRCARPPNGPAPEQHARAGQLTSRGPSFRRFRLDARARSGAAAPEHARGAGSRGADPFGPARRHAPR